jgi:iron complex transport system substrate-binding protein
LQPFGRLAEGCSGRTGSNRIPLTACYLTRVREASGILLLLTTLKQKCCRRSALAALILLTLCQCSPQNSQVPTPPSAVHEIVDDVGRRVSVAQEVERVVSLAPNLTEIVYAVGAGETLVGVTSYCDYPAEAKSVAKVGDTLHPSIERIIALRPQVVLVSTSSQLETFASQLDSRIAVFVTDPRDLEGVFRSIQQVGLVLNRQSQAGQLVEQLRARTASVEKALKARRPTRVFYQLSDEPLYTAGRDAFVTDLIRRAGGASITATLPGAWPKYSAESALAGRPDAIILPTGGATGTGNSVVTEALKRSPAAINGKVFKINADHLSRPGPRAVDGLEEMARLLHPEAFKR